VALALSPPGSSPPALSLLGSLPLALSQPGSPLGSLLLALLPLGSLPQALSPPGSLPLGPLPLALSLLLAPFLPVTLPAFVPNYWRPLLLRVDPSWL
jgi:hypothetical protein